jgi:hypothetical protein
VVSQAFGGKKKKDDDDEVSAPSYGDLERGFRAPSSLLSKHIPAILAVYLQLSFEIDQR